MPYHAHARIDMFVLTKWKTRTSVLKDRERTFWPVKHLSGKFNLCACCLWGKSPPSLTQRGTTPAEQLDDHQVIVFGVKGPPLGMEPVALAEKSSKDCVESK